MNTNNLSFATRNYWYSGLNKLLCICRIYLKDLFELGVENGTAVEEPTKYSVVDGNKIYSGEIKVGITFTAKVTLNVSLFCYVLIYFTFPRPYFRPFGI